MGVERDKSLQATRPASRVPGWNLTPAYPSDSVAQALSNDLGFLIGSVT